MKRVRCVVVAVHVRMIRAYEQFLFCLLTTFRTERVCTRGHSHGYTVVQCIWVPFRAASPAFSARIVDDILGSNHHIITIYIHIRVDRSAALHSRSGACGHVLISLSCRVRTLHPRRVLRALTLLHFVCISRRKMTL